jgi:hypothetical protein
MRYLSVGALVCVCLGLASTGQAQAPDPQVVAPINTFLEAFNKGDAAGAAATHAATADLVIVDEVSPYVWHGAQAFQSWAADLERHDKAEGVTDQHVALGAVTRVESDGTQAYVIAPSVYTFKQKGVAMRAAAQMTFTLKKGASGWLIQGWTWTGPKARKVAAAPAPAVK